MLICVYDVGPSAHPWRIVATMDEPEAFYDWLKEMCPNHRRFINIRHDEFHSGLKYTMTFCLDNRDFMVFKLRWHECFATG